MRFGCGGEGCEERHRRDGHTKGDTGQHPCLLVCISSVLTCPHSYQSSLGKKGRGTEGPREKLGAESGVTSAGSVQEGGT